MLDDKDTVRFVGNGFSADATKSRATEGRYYTDESIYREEIDKVFGYEWNYFCHQSQIPNVGDYLSGVVCEQAVYVVRGRDNTIRAFYNVCQHRGHELLKEGCGSVGSVVVCPYHAWSYDLEGKLRGAPMMKEVKDFDRSNVRLSSIRIEIIGGFVFLNFDPNAKTLREMAPEFEPILKGMVAEVDKLQFVKQSNYDIAANWKIVTENFLEAYHVEYSGEAHEALRNIIDVDTYRFSIKGRTIEYLAGGGESEVLPYDQNEKDDFTNARDAPFHQVFLYPHMTFSVFPGTNMLFVFNMRPVGPQRTSEDIIYFTLDGSMSAPTATAESYVSNQLNAEDVKLVEAVQRGLRSRGYVPGRYMVDAEQQAGWSEHFVHHFNTLNLDALTR